MSVSNKPHIGIHFGSLMTTDRVLARTSRRILILEDEVLTRLLLTEMLTKAGFDVIGCGSSKEALKNFDSFDPDALIFDINIGDGTSGLDLMCSFLRKAPYLAGVILSNFAITPERRDPELKDIAYLRKRDLIDTTILLETLEKVLSNNLRTEESVSAATSTLSNLTGAQLEVLRLIAEGLTNQEIAIRRKSTLRAIEQMVNRLFSSLGINSEPSTNPRVMAARIYISALGMPATK